jgi:hypothetical protein
MAVTKSRIRLYGALLVCNLIVFSLSAHVNSFTSFFYVADLFPFAMSIITFVIVGGTLLGDLKGSNPVLSRPMIELPWLAILAVLWLCLNSFSSSRWRYVQAGDCGDIPSDSELTAVTVWCKEVQALRSFVWVEWLIVVASLLWLWLQTSREASRGNRQVWSTSFARPAKRDLGRLSFDAARRSVGAMSTGAASSFHTSDDHSRYSTNSQPFPDDFEKESVEHYNNTHNAYVPRHQHNTSGSSSHSQQQRYQQGQQGYGSYGYDQQYSQQQSYGYDQNYPQQQGYGYDQQYPQQQQDFSRGYLQQQPAQQQPAQQYPFVGYGQAQ